MGNDSTIIDDLSDRVAALEALVRQLTAQRAEKDRVNAELTAQNAKLAATVQAQAAQIADLKGKLAAANKNSSNSSKPPSSDLFKPTPPKRRRKKKSVNCALNQDQKYDYLTGSPKTYSGVAACGANTAAGVAKAGVAPQAARLAAIATSPKYTSSGVR